MKDGLNQDPIHGKTLTDPAGDPYKARTERILSAAGKARAKRKKRRGITWGSIGTVCLALLLVLFVPYDKSPPSTRRYAESEYFGVIGSLNGVTYYPPAADNNFEALTMQWRYSMGCSSYGPPVSAERLREEDLLGSVMRNSGGLTGGSYIVHPPASLYTEIPEGDSDGTALPPDARGVRYEIRGGEIRLSSDESGDTLSVLTVAESAEDRTFPRKLLLSEDGETLSVIARRPSETLVVNFDVRDPRAVTETGRFAVSGSVQSARYLDGRLCLITYHLVRYDRDFSVPETFVPHYGTPEETVLLSSEQILHPEEATNSAYTVISLIDPAAPAEASVVALLSYTAVVSVSEPYILLTRVYTEETRVHGTVTVSAFSEIAPVFVQGGSLLLPAETVTVLGVPEDQYSMDVYAGTLRVVTTSLTAHYGVGSPYGSGAALTRIGERASSVLLYCVEAKDFGAPAEPEVLSEGETVRSVRFEGGNVHITAEGEPEQLRKLRVNLSGPYYPCPSE